MPSPEAATALLVLDFQVGLAEKPFAATALAKVTQAVQVARRDGLLVVYSRVGFRSGYPEVASWNPVFGPYAAQNQLPVGASRLPPELVPAAGEPVVEKSRFSPFAGTDLTMLLRAQRITGIAVAGISTSGVVLAAFLHAENEDLAVTVLKTPALIPTTNCMTPLSSTSSHARQSSQQSTTGHRRTHRPAQLSNGKGPTMRELESTVAPARNAPSLLMHSDLSGRWRNERCGVNQT